MGLPRDRPLLIYDGNCGFCRFCVDYWAKLTGGQISFAPFQEVAPEFPEIHLDEFQAAVQLIEPDGSRSRAAEAVFHTLACVPRYGGPLWLYRHAPGFAQVSEFTYRVVARHRPFFDKLRLFFWGRTLDPPTHFLTRWVFLRLLGIAYLAAFASLWPQIPGLIGVHGILPTSNFLAMVTQAIGPARYRLLPTLAWLNSSNGFLEFIAGTGTALSILLIIGIASGPVLLVLWIFYLSLVTAGQDFLSFQWDILLLEAGFLAIFLAPWRHLLVGWKIRRADSAPGSTASPPSRAIVWLLRWLLFRLVFLSGCVKLLSHDPSWRNLTALEYHYETQPLPTPVAWYAYHLPAWFQKASVVGVFAIELFVPFLIFTPRRTRFAGCAALVSFQVLIALTGNYAFFNLLTISLCVLLLDDQFLRRALPRILTLRFPSSLTPVPRRLIKQIAVAALTPAILFGSTELFATTLFGRQRIPEWAAEATGWIEPFHVVNSYGLFAVMTTSRLEIIIQGSNDHANWRDYEFKYKPEDMNKEPQWVAPYQPRLDWQMWFAALSSYGNNPWFENLMLRLLQGSKPVLGLLDKNPFPNEPPRYLRALVYDYGFTSFGERQRTGDWWERKLMGLYFPIATLRR
jgi:lipase maturation factor 1